MVPVVAGFRFRLKVWVNVADGVDCWVAPFTLLGVPVMVQVNVTPAAAPMGREERSLVVPEQ
jgi:hypothetical protein